MKVFYPYLFHATFSKGRFELPTLYHCVQKYANNINTLHYRRNHSGDHAYLYVDSWKSTDDTLRLLNKFERYDKVNVYHNTKGDYWTFTPIFNNAVPQITIESPLKIMEYELQLQCA